MPVIKKSDKSKSKSVGSSLDKSPTGSKYNLKFEKVSKSDEGGNTSKRLKCVTSNFKCLFYKRKTRESDGRSESSKSSSPTGDSVNSSSSTPEGFQSPDLISKVSEIEIPVARERRKRTTSGDGSLVSGSGGTLDRPVPVPRTSRSSIIPSHSGRIPSHQVIYNEQSSLHNFHLQTLANFNPQSHLIFRPPRQNFRHPSERQYMTSSMSGASANGPPLPPRNNSNFPSVVYAPGRHGPMVAYVRGPFPPSRHPQHGSIRPPPVPHFPPPHVMQMRARQSGQSHQAFILRYPPPPRLLFRSPYEQPNYYNHQGEPYHSNQRNHHHHHSSLPTLHETKYPLSGLDEDDSVQNMHLLPSIPLRNQSLSAQSYVSLSETQNEQLQQHHNSHSFERPLQILKEDSPPINNNRNMRKENSKVESSSNNNDSPVKNSKTDENHGDGDGDVIQEDEINPSSDDPTTHASPLWPTVLIDHKLPRVPNPMQDNNQRQIVTENMRQIGNRKASHNFCNANVAKTSGSSTSSPCSDLQRMEVGHKSDAPWFRWCASRIDGESSKDLRQRRNNNNSSLVNNNGGGDGANVNCVRCSKVLPKPGGGLLLSQPVECSICSLRVCKGCAVWNKQKNSLTCGHCHPPTSIDRRINFWLDGVSHGESSFVTAERDKTTKDVREHLERLVESYIDEGVATVSLSRLYDNPQYDVLFHRFHQKLSDGLMNLGYSLKLAIENKPLSETPTSAHTTLTNLLVEVKEAAMELPLMETTTVPREKTKDEIISDAADGKKSGGEGQSSYEDVLATAILNKVVLNGQKTRNKSDSPMSLVDSAVQTDSEMSETSEIVTQKNQYNVQGWVTNLEKRSPQQHSNLSDDDLSMGTSSSNWSNEGPTNRGGTHQQIVIEEQVEEITTTYESDSDIGHSPPVRNRKLRKSGRHQRSNNSEIPPTVVTNEDPLFGVDLSNFDKRAPFPEGGVDIITPTEAGILPEDEARDPKAAALLVSQISEWEQNWLFKRRKQLFKKRNLMAEAVPMLVPNPNEEGVEPQIGAEKASDLSDLSDHANEDDEDGDYMMSSTDEEKDNKTPAEDSTVVDSPDAKTTNGHQVEVITTQIHRPQEKKSSLVEQQINVGKIPSNQPDKQEKVNPVTKVKVKPERKVERGMSFTTIPQDCKVSAGRTAKFVCTIGETSPSYSVAWFFDGVLITSEKGKRWIYSAENTHRHYLYIYDVNENDAGNYHVSIFDHRGNETKHSFKLIVSATEQRRTDPPTFTVLKEIVKSSTQENVLTIPFEISGFPEPYLEIYRNNVEISKLSHVLLEGEGSGKWVLQIRKNETDFSVDGEYVAVAKNKGGMTKITFQIQNSEGVPTAIAETQKVTKANLAATPESQAKSLSPQPRPVSAASQVSSIEETLRETSQSMDANQTLIKEDYEELLEWERSRNIDSSKMTIAEREKLKWQNPVNLVNNPYAPENLAKRIRQRENSGFSLPPSKSGDISVTSSDDERPSVDRLAQNYKKFSRDYYVHGVQASPSKLPTGPKFATSLPVENSRNKTPASSKESSVEKEEVPKDQPVSRKPSFLVMEPVVSESPAEISKVPLQKRESIREKFEEAGKKMPTETNKVLPLHKRQISSSPTPPPPEIRSSSSPTPSSDRSRLLANIESRSSKKDSVDLEAIKLPSVKRLAQQFNKEPSPEETKVKDMSKVNPPINHITRNLIKDSKSIQQVHSLTARSVSREFREGLRLSHPSPPNMNIKVAPKLSPSKEYSPETKQEDQNESERETVTVSNNSKNSDINRLNGEDSESQNNSTNNDMLTSAALNKTKRTACNSILSRAAFWDKRVKDGIVDDDVAIKEFPKVEGVADQI